MGKDFKDIILLQILNIGCKTVQEEISFSIWQRESVGAGGLMKRHTITI